MRALAMRVGISPMAIYHHFQDRDGLIRALGDMVYSDVGAPPAGCVRSRIEGLLSAYRSKVVRHPNLTLAIFTRPAVFPDHAKRITESLAELLGELGLPALHSRLWVHILVDYTHGAALATAMGGGSTGSNPAASDTGDEDYSRAVCELLARLEG